MFSQFLKAVKCPVGKENLGMRPGRKAFRAFCHDCGFWYYWGEGKLVPASRKPKKLPQKCGCAVCEGKGR